MNRSQEIKSQIEDGITLRNSFLNEPENIQWIENITDSIVNSLRAGGKVIFAGNGGSFADAQHLSAEFLGRFMIEREPLSAHCLGTNSSLTTAIGNDYSFNQIFSRELKGIGKKEDTLILISTSGNSKDLIEAAEVAKENKIMAYGLSGKDGGELANIVNCVVIPSRHTARIQEMHITIGHVICDLIDKIMITPNN